METQNLAYDNRDKYSNGATSYLRLALRECMNPVVGVRLVGLSMLNSDLLQLN